MRKSGILMHISSLPSKYGIGTLGKAAYEFIDFLKKADQTYWQILPIGPTSYGDSPYQTFSVFAGNPYFIDLDFLVGENLLTKGELDLLEIIDEKAVDYGKIYQTRFIILRKAFENFIYDKAYHDFLSANRFWIDDYALFMAIKRTSGGGNWQTWDELLQRRDKIAINAFIATHQKEVEFWKFVQYMFFHQWKLLKDYAKKQGIALIGDMPIYVAYDSCDVWANPTNWQLDENFNPIVVAGVPPDYFSETGQLWGNPIYDYSRMEKDKYSWWVKRVEYALSMFDYLRIDHFRGFESYYAIPAKDETAEFGKWIKGPGISLFECIKNKIDGAPIIAEDLGLLTPEVYELLDQTGYPGMRVLQFGFDPLDDSLHLPHNFPKNCLCYTGTHDNMTLKEWLKTLNKVEMQFVYDYLDLKSNHIYNEDEVIDGLIKCALGSVAQTVIIPITDYLHLDSESRFNNPSTFGGNWIWRVTKEQLDEKLIQKIAFFTNLYRRKK